jgi:hypothetical protein
MTQNPKRSLDEIIDSIISEQPSLDGIYTRIAHSNKIGSLTLSAIGIKDSSDPDPHVVLIDKSEYCKTIASTLAIMYYIGRLEALEDLLEEPKE